MELGRITAKCFLCDAPKGAFDTEQRVCDCSGLDDFPKSEHPLYVTNLPDPGDYDISLLPRLSSTMAPDVYATLAKTSAATDCSPGTENHEQINQLLGNSNLLSVKYGLRCGNPILYRIPRLEKWAGFSEIYVLDMGTYLWSGTLKDPRSWAIINTALENGVTHLSLWTAGNAGMSLAKLAYAVNRHLPPEKRLHVYGLVDNEVSMEVRTRLRTWQCEVLNVPTKSKFILDPEEIKNEVATRMVKRGQSIDSVNYWHVTDGWDGVGLLMYRFLGAQVIRDLKPQYVVAPVGTGDLLLGLHLGLSDCIRSDVFEEGECKLIGVVPVGENILDNIENQRINPVHQQPGDRHPNELAPVAPKLIGRYSPLAPCISRLVRKRRVRFIQIDANDQLAAGQHTLDAGIDIGIACEPSALVAFAALPYLNSIARELEDGPTVARPFHSNSRVVVINTGMGVLSAAEENVLLKVFSA
jgi:cysteine synthase